MRELDALIKQHNARQDTEQYLACLTGGIAAAAAYNAAGATKQDGTAFSASDFLPGNHDTKQQSPEEMIRTLDLISDIFGGQRTVN